MLKKLLIFFFFFSLSTETFSEEYVCSFNLSQNDRPGEVEIKTYTRSGNYFVQEGQFGKSVFQITNETKEFIILTKTYPYPSIYIVMIDKKKKKFMEEFLDFEDPDLSGPMTGKCLIKN